MKKEVPIWERLARLYLFSLPFSLCWIPINPLFTILHIAPIILLMFGSMFYDIVLDDSSDGGGGL